MVHRLPHHRRLCQEFIDKDYALETNTRCPMLQTKPCTARADATLGQCTTSCTTCVIRHPRARLPHLGNVPHEVLERMCPHLANVPDQVLARTYAAARQYTTSCTRTHTCAGESGSSHPPPRYHHALTRARHEQNMSAELSAPVEMSLQEI